MDQNLETHIFSAWYPAQELMAESTTTRRVHKWFVNMMMNTESRYFVVIRDETEAERVERILAERVEREGELLSLRY